MASLLRSAICLSFLCSSQSGLHNLNKPHLDTVPTWSITGMLSLQEQVLSQPLRSLELNHIWKKGGGSTPHLVSDFAMNGSSCVCAKQPAVRRGLVLLSTLKAFSTTPSERESSIPSIIPVAHSTVAPAQSTREERGYRRAPHTYSNRAALFHS